MDIKDKNQRKSYSDLEAIAIPSPPSPSSSASASASASAASQQATQIPTGRQSYWNAKFLAESTDDPEPVVVPGQQPHVGTRTSTPSHHSHNNNNNNNNKGDSSSSPVDTLPAPPPAYYLVDSKGQTQALYTVPTNTSNGSDADSIVNFKAGIGGAAGAGGGSYIAAAAAAAPPAPGGWWKSMGQGQRILGMRKNVFLAVCAGLCFLVLGLLLTVLLVTRTINLGGGKGGGGGGGPNNGNSNVPSFSTPVLLSQKDMGPMLSATNLASMNWTNTSTGNTYTALFYQSSRATGLSLMAAIRDEATATWTTLNVSASAGATDVLPGTPLAAANNNGLWNLLYLSSSFALQEIYSTAPMDATGWLRGAMATQLGNPGAMPGSGLGAMWQSCSNCSNALFVTWQDGATGNIMYANETNLTWGSPMTLSANAAPGSSVAVSAFTDFNGTGSTGADKNAVRFYYENGDGLDEKMLGPLGNFKLVAGNFGKPIASNLPVQPSPALASMTYGEPATGWTNNLLAYVDPWKGSLTSVNWHADEWKVAVPTLHGAPDGLEDAGFSAVALTQEMRVYLMCPSMGAIHEFTANATDPTDWTWTESLNL